ncbi:TonB-dependent receptor [Pinirhizobacter sp.]|jgi:iron complex outermembrane receptor protein|uniref:TonB-dependent receptor n=1 Tax=Pinirhizobacter sp. TaxID=2950432 RepID=UPI002F3FD99E
MKLRYSALYMAVAAVLATSAMQAAAQDAATDTGASKKDIKQLDAVQVSATKRETPLQKTPVAVTAITPDALDKERVMTVQDLTKLVPGFQATTQGDHGVITLTMRGIGNDSAKTEYADPEVATFVDGVYSPRPEAAAGLLLDMDGVEVLRGPQGTLWGRNSTAGVVSFQTAKPELGSFYGNASIEAGNYSMLGTRAAVNLPVSDTLAFRVAVAHQEHDGYVDYQNPSSQLPSVAQQQATYLAGGGNPAAFQPINTHNYITGGDKYNAQDQSAARISALWQPSDAFQWNVSYEYFKDRGTPNMSLMQHPRDGQDFWSALMDTAPYEKRDSSTVRSRMDWTLTDSMQLSYIAGYNRYSGKSDFDQDNGAVLPTSFTTGGVFQEDRTNYSNYENYSHEIDLKSTGEQTLDWILGLYYSAEDNNIRFDIPILNGTQQGTVNWQGAFLQPEETVQSKAVFGQATWHITDGLRLTGGLRWSDDEKRNDGGRGWGWNYDPTVPQSPISPDVEPSAANGFAVSTVNDAKYSNHKVTWLTRLDADVSEHGLVYASVSTGYKSGGTQDAGALYKAETLTNYEVGSKFAFWDGHLTWNTAAYYENFKNFQLSAPITYPNGNRGLGFSNVQGSTKVMGLESELAFQTQDDRANLVFSAIPKKKLGTLKYAGSNDYQGLPACSPQSGISNCIDITGNTLPHAPGASLTAIYEHDFHLSNGGRLTPRVSAQYQSRQELSVYNLGAGDEQRAYGRGDVSLRYSEPKDRWYAGVFVQNVTDGKVRTNAARFALPDGSFTYVSEYLPPRTYGVNFGVWF